MAFAPGQHLLVSAVGGASQDSMDTMWDVTDGRILASVTGTDQVAVWNVTAPARAARIATLTGRRLRPGDHALPPREPAGQRNLQRHRAGVQPGQPGPPRPHRHDQRHHGRRAVPGRAAAASVCPALPLVQPSQLRGGVHPGRAHPDSRRRTPRGQRDFRVQHCRARHGVHVERDQLRRSQRPHRRQPQRRGQPTTLAPDGRTVADGSPTSNAVYLWTPP